MKNNQQINQVKHFIQVMFSFVILVLVSSFNSGLASDKSKENFLTIGNPKNLDIEFGKLSFGVEPFQHIGKATGYKFRINGNFPVDEGYIVFGFNMSKDRKPQVWSAFTTDGINYYDPRILFELPDSDPPGQWKGGSVAMGNNGLLLLQCQLGSPPLKGHPFHTYSGSSSGSGWHKLTNNYIYKGQDSFCMVWNKQLGKFVNYQISYQPFAKKYPDNIPKIRRVLHIRTSPDGITWTPGESFGGDGPYLPDDQLIVPDELDYPDTEFYHFSVIELGEFWAGLMVKYVSQPGILPNRKPWPHGPFLNYEWWISSDGLTWERPFRENSGLEEIPLDLAYHLMQPIKFGDELRWTSNDQVYSINQRRMFYAYCRANAEIVTSSFSPSEKPISVEVSFESVKRQEAPPLHQGYLMAELLDENGEVIPGFERDKCLFMPDKSTQLKLKWGDLILPDKELYTSVRLRLSFRDVKLYSVSY